jgi:hypothetical protein
MDGTWKFSRSEEKRWNELQNTPGDIVRLSDHLLDLYRRQDGALSEKAA